MKFSAGGPGSSRQLNMLSREERSKQDASLPVYATPIPGNWTSWPRMNTPRCSKKCTYTLTCQNGLRHPAGLQQHGVSGIGYRGCATGDAVSDAQRLSPPTFPFRATASRSSGRWRRIARWRTGSFRCCEYSARISTGRIRIGIRPQVNYPLTQKGADAGRDSNIRCRV